MSANIARIETAIAQMQDALLTIVQTHATREFLFANDPRAYHQARAALVESGVDGERFAACPCWRCKSSAR